MSNDTLGIGRGWAVFSSDGKRVGDVTEVHPHYLLVSRGVLLVRDIFLPLGTVERTEEKRVILTVTHDVLRKMDLSHVPPPPPEPAPLQDPAADPYAAPSYTPDSTTEGEIPDYGSSWGAGMDSTPFEELPSYTRPSPNGLVEVEPSLNLAYQDCGYGTPVLLMQGWPFDSTVWEPMASILADDYRTITFDPRGLGNSDRTWDYYSVDGLSNDLHRLIVEQALRDVTIVAWSTAALVALTYAREHPGRVERLVLLNPLVPFWLAEDTVQERLGIVPGLDAATQEAWAGELLEDRAAWHEKLIDRLTHTPLSKPRRRWLWQRLMLGTPYAQRKTWEAMRIYDPSYVLPEVAVPVTIICGENDHLSPPALGAYLAAQLPRGQAVTLSECGHASFLDQREAVVTAIRDLLRSGYEQAAELPEEQSEDDHTVEDELGAISAGEAGAVGLDQPATVAPQDAGPVINMEAKDEPNL